MLNLEVDDLQCKICGAHATGFHFDAQSCSACCAFFRRAISLKRIYKCPNNFTSLSTNSCTIVYTERKLCRACRLRKCFSVGMNKNSVQGPKSMSKKIRTYCTRSGLRRNKRFSVISNANSVWTRDYASNGDVDIVDIEYVNSSSKNKKISNPILQSSEKLTAKITVIENFVAVNPNTVLNINDQQVYFEQEGNSSFNLSTHSNSVGLSPNCLPHSNSLKNCNDSFPKISIQQTHKNSDTTSLRSISLSSHLSSLDRPNILTIFIEEEMRIAERRRILFCERPVGSLLGTSKTCPFTLHDIKPLNFHEFRKSIRIHILLIYEWLRVCPQYSLLCKQDQITFMRKCVLYHTILDPCFITLRIGDFTKFVMPNGGYVSTVSTCDDGWHDEKEISRNNKKKIYGPLLNRIMTEIIAQMVNLRLEFEEFVALKALVSIQMTICDASESGRAIMKQASNEICRALSEHYFISDNLEKAARFGNILLLLSPIYDTATNFVESHHQLQFFDLWQLDSLLLQFLKNKV